MNEGHDTLNPLTPDEFTTVSIHKDNDLLHWFNCSKCNERYPNIHHVGTKHNRELNQGRRQRLRERHFQNRNSRYCNHFSNTPTPLTCKIRNSLPE